MKTFKMSKTMYYDLPLLLKKADAIVKNQALPTFTMVNIKTYKRMEREIKKMVVRELGRLPKKTVDYEAGMYLLNYGPFPLEGRGLRDGYVLVDTAGLNETKEQILKEKSK